MVNNLTNAAILLQEIAPFFSLGGAIFEIAGLVVAGPAGFIEGLALHLTVFNPLETFFSTGSTFQQ